MLCRFKYSTVDHSVITHLLKVYLLLSKFGFNFQEHIHICTAKEAYTTNYLKKKRGTNNTGESKSRRESLLNPEEKQLYKYI